MRRISFRAGGALCLTAALAMATPTAAADAATTVTSFTLAGGSLSVAQGSGTFTDDAAAATQTALGEVVVRDTRGSTLGWTAYATATVSAAGGTTVVSYGSGPIAATGSVTATSRGTTQLSTVAVPVVVGTEVIGNNLARWTPTVTAFRAAESAAPVTGDLHREQVHTGTVTHSVL